MNGLAGGLPTSVPKSSFFELLKGLDWSSSLSETDGIL